MMTIGEKKMNFEPFWIKGQGDTYSIDRTKLISFLSDQGFGMFRDGKSRNDTGSLIYIDDGTVRPYSKKSMRQWVNHVIDDLETEQKSQAKIALHKFKDFQDELTTVLPIYSEYPSKSDKWVRHLEFIRDDQNICRFPFQNGVVEVTKDSISLLPLTSVLPNLIWESQITPRDIELIDGNSTPSDTCHFGHFLSQSMKIGIDGQRDEQHQKRLRSLQSSIGYLLHRFNDPTVSKAVVFIDAESSKDSVEGRNGKSIVGTAIDELIPTQVLDGRKNGPLLGTDNGRFIFDRVKSETRCLIFDDCTDNFKFDGLFNIITGGLEIEKKHEGSYTIPPERKPKFLLTTNYVLPTIGTSYRARQHIVEFGSYWNHQFHKGVQPIDELGKRLFDPYQWDDDDWNQFYNYLFSCVQLYLSEGLIESSLDSYRKKQIKIQIEGNQEVGFVDWIDSWIRGDRLRRNQHLGDGISIDALYLEFQKEVDDSSWGLSTFKDRLWNYCRVMGYGFNNQLSHKGSTRTDRRNRKGPRGQQTEWVCITTPNDQTLLMDELHSGD